MYTCGRGSEFSLCCGRGRGTTVDKLQLEPGSTSSKQKDGIKEKRREENGEREEKVATTAAENNFPPVGCVSVARVTGSHPVNVLNPKMKR